MCSRDFFKSKPAEELYDCEKDPDNIHNLAGQKEYGEVLDRMRKANQKWLIDSKDAGFIPEARKESLSETTTIYEYTHSGKYNIEKVMETAEIASSGDSKYLNALIAKLKDNDPDIRYWAATGCTILGKKAEAARKDLKGLLNDAEVAVQIAAAEALYQLGENEKAIGALIKALKSDNTMARVQALNVLESTNKHDAVLARNDLQSIIAQNRAEYDVRAAKRLLSELPGQ